MNNTNELEFVAEYLARDLAETSLYDIKKVKTKIKTALTLLLDKNIGEKTLFNLRAKVSNHVRHAEKMQIENRYWKTVAKSILSETEMQEHYNKLDAMLNKNFSNQS
jgi:hypothetical protein